MLIKLDGLRADQQRGVMVVSAKSADGMLRRLLGPKIHDEVKKLRNANRREELNSIIKLAQKGEDIYKLTPGRKRAIEARVANLKLYQGDAHRSTGLSRVMLNKLRKLEPLMPEPEVGKEP